MLLTQADHRPAHLSRVREALVSLPRVDRLRLGIDVDWHGAPHQLTYRQVEYLNALVETALGKHEPDGLASEVLQRFVDALIEASVPQAAREGSTSLAIDWTDYESFAHPPAGLTEMMGTRHPRKVVMTRKNGRDCPNEACYYASL